MKEEKNSEIGNSLQGEVSTVFAQQVFFQKAEALRVQGRPREALDACLAGVERKPDSMAGRLLLGKCYWELGQKKRAREEFERVAREIEDSMPVYHWLSQIYLEDREVDRALEALRRALYFSAGDAAKKVTPLEMDLLHRRPAPPFAAPPAAAIEKAVVEEAPAAAVVAVPADGAVEIAVEEKERAKAAILTDTLAQIYKKQGHWQKALSIYEDILARDPENEAVRKKAQAMKRKMEGLPRSGDEVVKRLQRWLAVVTTAGSAKTL